MATFVMAARSRSSAVFKQNESLTVTYARTGAANPVQLTFRTRYMNKGYAIPVPEEIWVDARGPASDVHDAAECFANMAREVATLISLTANASVSPLEPEIIYDGTPGQKKRGFFQRFLPEKPVTAISGRVVDVDTTHILMRSVGAHHDRQRIMRAAAQYNLALEYWSMGTELLAMGHLFMGIEALKVASLRHCLQTYSMTPEQLAAEWGWKPGSRSAGRFLDAESRLHLIFKGDKQAYKDAKDASDGFEHGLANPGDLRPSAMRAVNSVAHYLREAIFDVLDLPEETRKKLNAPPLDVVRGPMRIETYLWGHLNGDGEELAAPQNEYPVFRWERRIEKIECDSATGIYGVQYSNKMTALLAEGIVCTLDRAEMWDGSKIQPIS